MLLFQLSGSFLLRFEALRLFSLLFHEPPRNAPPASLQAQAVGLNMPSSFWYGFEPGAQQFANFQQRLGGEVILGQTGQFSGLRQAQVQAQFL